MPVMSPAELQKFIDEQFPQAVEAGAVIEHLRCGSILPQS